jgi:hypothetical protein
LATAEYFAFNETSACYALTQAEIAPVSPRLSRGGGPDSIHISMAQRRDSCVVAAIGSNLRRTPLDYLAIQAWMGHGDVSAVLNHNAGWLSELPGSASLEPDQWCQVFAIARLVEEPASKMTTSTLQKILFFTPYGEWQVHNQVDVTVAAAMQGRNCQICFLTCDGFYQPCAITRVQQDCARCQSAIAATLAPFDLRTSSLGALSTSEDAARADLWLADLPDEALATACFDDLPIGDWAVSTVMTHFRVSQVQQLSDPRIVPVHRRFIRDTLLTYWAIDRVLGREHFDALFLFNARFYPYRAAFEAARRRKVRILVHERGRIGNSFSLFEGESCLGLETPRRLAKAWSEVPLDESEGEKLDSHFSKLLIGHSSNWPAYNDTIRNFDPRTVLDVPGNAKFIGFFTSSLDEISNREGFGDANRQFELIESVARAIDGTDNYLVVRHHPHIAGAANSQVEVSGFYEAYRQAVSRNKNVRIIMPRDDFTSYALFPYLTAAIAPFSSISLELVAFGIPTLVSEISLAEFDERFILTDWSTQGVKAAVDFLVGSEARLRADDLRRFYRKCYSLLFRYSVEFQVIGIKDYFYAVTKFETMDALLPGHDPALDRVCDHLLIGAPVHRQPDKADTTRSCAEEDRFIGRQLDVFEKRREWLGPPVTRLNIVREPTNSFAVIMDETVESRVTGNHWMRLPFARSLSTKSLRPGNVGGWLARAVVRWHASKASEEFAAWCQGLRHLLKNTKEDYVLVTNPRFQFHDTAIVAISEAVKSASSTKQPVVALSGWLRDPDQLLPLRLQLVKTDLHEWRKTRMRLGDSLRAQDISASVVLRREWLIAHLNDCQRTRSGADAFENALFKAVIGKDAEISVTQPVFLLR